MTDAPQPWPVLQAPAHWRTIDFISDLHLHASQPHTLRAWQNYMAQTRADALFILGDLFEVWVGDDAIDPVGSPDQPEAEFERSCVRTLADTGRRLDLHFMHGNRDFLAGAALMAACHMRLLPDPTVLQFGMGRWLLSHGDALCLGDTDYLRFRAEVRTAAWQQSFLARPLAQRRLLAAQMRSQSEARKQQGRADADVEPQAALQWLHAAGASTLIHGHTHRPARHALGQGTERIVLSDWDAGVLPARTEVLRIALQGEAAGAPQRIAAALA